MCNFLSLVETDHHKLFFFTPEQRIAHAKEPFTDKRDNAYSMDSHASICAYYGLDEDAVNKYEWNPYTRALTIDNKVFDAKEDRVQKSLDEIDWHPICGDIEGLRAFCDRIKDIPFFRRCGSLPDGVKLCKDRDAAMDSARAAALNAARDFARTAAWNAARYSAWNAARDSARDSAWNAASDAASDAAMNAVWDSARASARDVALDAARNAIIVYLCVGLPVDAKHLDYTQKRWSVWEAGYGMLCDVDGVLYCYEKP